ncbi:hypothetical protein Q9L58_010443 [Maublancomyces gigas]|uniref:Endonuclease/exonuclease/phosphatase domain-containing protein n=1 Tax=Discina gigas TaxID=1032678 RepID=A0ABR3G446_9PEZI
MDRACPARTKAMIPRTINPPAAPDCMSHIHLTGIAKVQQLNCANGKASTISAINDIDESPNILLMLLQEPCITDNSQPPHAINYDLLLPTQKNAKYGTYIRKNIGLQPTIRSTYEDCILSITATIGKMTAEFMNVYAPSKKEIQKLTEKDKPLTDCLLAGDFNTHHLDCNQPTIPDLTFASNHLFTLTQEWSCSEGEEGDSDHALITTTLNIKPTTFTARRQYHKAMWGVFELHIGKLAPKEDCATPADAIAEATLLDRQIQEGVDIAIIWSKPNHKSKSWWTPDLMILKIQLAEAKQVARSELDNPQFKAQQKIASRKWRRAIRRAQW